jgi:hypothetical protein
MALAIWVRSILLVWLRDFEMVETMLRVSICSPAVRRPEPDRCCFLAVR